MQTVQSSRTQLSRATAFAAATQLRAHRVPSSLAPRRGARIVATWRIGTLPGRDEGPRGPRVNGKRCRRGGGDGTHVAVEMGESLETPRSTWAAIAERAVGANAALACAATAMFLATAVPWPSLAESEFYIEDVPQGLSSGELAQQSKAPSLASLVKGPNGKEIEKCATKCIATCTRGGSGAPGLGPMSIRKAPVVFKEGFRSRQYCLTECTEICNITVTSSKERR